MTKNKIKKIGFVLDNLGPNQLAYQLIKSGNILAEQSDKVDVVLFYRNFAPIVTPPSIAIFTVYDAFNYDGDLVVTNIQDAMSATRWPGPNRHNIYWYLQNLEWLQLRNAMAYEEYAKVYLNPKLRLVCRSQDHYDIVNAVWRTPYAIVEDGNVNKFLEVIE
jgi:hypothetical protein